MRTGVRKVAQVSSFDHGHVSEINVEDESALLSEALQHEHTMQKRIVEGSQTEKSYMYV